MFWHVVFTSALFAAQQASAGGPEMMDTRFSVRTADVLERRYADLAVHYVERRQAPQPQSDVILNPDGTLNMTAWDEETSRACRDALSRLELASNPSGTCICYNLPSLDTNTGVFEADLRLFKISEPTGAFTGIPPQNIQVGLSYNGASVSPVSAARIQSTQRVNSRDLVGRDETHPLAKRNASLELLQAYLFVGMIDAPRMSPELSMAQLEALVMPILTLTAVNSSGQTISTNVSSNEAAFVTGVFSQEVIMSEFAVANAAVNEIVTELNNGTVAFVLPGVQILIFPVGLIITSTWLVLGVAAYGYGTYMRIGYAEQFRRRTALANNSKRTI